MISITTVSHKTDDVRHPLLMLTNREGSKYFFGKVPEGTQRMLNASRIKLGNLKSVFLTGTLSSWSDIGGLPGFFLTLSDSTKKGIEVFTNSSKILSYIVATWRGFVFRKGVELKIHDTQDHGIIGDNNLTIKPILIARKDANDYDPSLSLKLSNGIKKISSLMFPLDTSKVNTSDPESYRSDPTETEIHTHTSLPSPEEIEPSKSQKSINYLIRILPARGKFDPQKAKALGLKPGLNYRKLSQGLSVTNDEGQVVTPEQVLEPSKLYPKVLILDIPNVHYLEPTINSPEWFINDEDRGDEEIKLVYHFLGDDIDFEGTAYRSFLGRFPSDCKHVISHSKIADNTLNFKHSAINTLLLKSIVKDKFNLPHFDAYHPLATQGDTKYKLQQAQVFLIGTEEIHVDESLISLDTWSTLYDSEIEPLGLGSNKAETLSEELVSLEMVQESNTSLKDQIHVVTLGTGSAIPSLHRNVISTLIRVPHVEDGSLSTKSIILDGGENTLGTILRHFDAAQLPEVFQEISLIHLSHLHADHHLGIVSLINKWFEYNQNTTKKLYLVIPWQYDKFIQEWYKFEAEFNASVDLTRLAYLSCEEFIHDRAPEYQSIELEEFERRYECQDLTRVLPRKPLAPKNDQLIQELYHDLKINSIKTVRALHCAWAYSITVNLQVGSETFQVAYSGDTRPNPKFVDLGYGSDLLIHESTLDNELIEEALAKKHSTMIEAVAMARYMNCPKVILTHFSTRYSIKNDISTDPIRLTKLADQLNEYLVKYSSPSNIFNLERHNREVKGYDELEICFAFDAMNVRYGDIDYQRSYQEVLGKAFVGEVEEEKEKDTKRLEEKREAKRLERLNRGKKRKTGLAVMIFQLLWLYDSICTEISKRSKFNNPIVAKNFTRDLNLIPILKINSFIKSTKTNDITAILSDSTHKVFAIFPFKPTIVNFENSYHQRITYHTLNCSIRIKKANLRFASRLEALENYEVDVNMDLIILEILDLEIFQRDQVRADPSYERSLKFVYDEVGYRAKNGDQFGSDYEVEELGTMEWA
ncbi:uncharacterized protein CANTADRAFT_3582 [Suhomyces tanzawaensis NRRL Y-17324]|uniref:Telomere replication protein EST3 n=1 Tax=Suhomyces tanzawaensis NRRL Y-17324 TaxID=984487 RepID=A0A1E4SPN3_9ASCO|nr:uncharacterized protein CANTADRAFT_3582 [Suhomyces tanzawaensis NRRL Y-17324]ODV81481.1 hypothetical protein CANTADRAFT_3582 [Suhomyces tanzawaensis NRRL Y-17324]